MSADILYKTLYEKVLHSGSKKLDALCCVCLQTVADDMSSIQDEVQFQLTTTTVVVKLAYILEALIGKSFSDVSSIFNQICHTCKEATLSSYSFILGSRESLKVVNAAIEDLEKCFTDIPQSILNNCKSLFVEVDVNDVKSATIKSYFNTESIKNQAEALERMRLLIEDQNNITDMLDSYDEHSDVSDMDLNHDDKFGADELNLEGIPESQFESEEAPNSHQEHKLSTKGVINVQSANHLKQFYCPDCKAGFNSLQRYNNHRNRQKNCTSRRRGHYPCDQCKYTAVYKFVLNRHIRNQHDNPTIICQWCSKSCNSQSELKVHLLKHTDERNFECQECGRKFKTVSALNSHKTVHTGEKNYPCNFCDQTFRNTSIRNAHTRRHHIQNPVQCEVCEKVFKMKEDLQRHLKSHFEETKGKYPCSECTHRDYSKKALEQHFNFKHRGERNFKCELCEKNFGTQNILRSHIKITHGNKTYDCNECSQSFKSLFGLKSHMFKHTGLKPFPCNYCDKTFKDTNRRIDHIRRHHIFEPHECDICKKVYRTKADLNRHKKGHSDKKGNFPCSECEHRAYTKNELEQHFNYKHRGERPFKCEICDKNFGTKNILLMHMSTHKNKTYDCKECSRSFKSLFSYKSHMLKHTGETPYPCNYCDETFRDSNRRLDHIRRRHIMEPHECDICDKKYRTRADLYRHIKKHLGESSESKETAKPDGNEYEEEFKKYLTKK